MRLRKADEKAWLLIKKQDEYARHPGEIAEDTSVVSGRTVEEIAQAGMEEAVDLNEARQIPAPVFIEPMKATLVDAPFDRKGWLFEIKWDGYRAIADKGKDGVRLYSRNDKTMNEQFKPVVDSLGRLPFDGVLDGEIVVLDKSGRADFQLLQNYLRSGRGSLVYYVFDILYYAGRDLTGLPLARRKEILRTVLPAIPHIKLSDYVETIGMDLFAAAKENGVEGIVAKDAKSPYRPGRRGREWLKVKALMQQEAVIGGFTHPKGSRAGFGSLVLGAYEDGRLEYIGHSGGGFTEAQLKELTAPQRPCRARLALCRAAACVRHACDVGRAAPRLRDKVYGLDGRGPDAAARFPGFAGRRGAFGSAKGEARPRTRRAGRSADAG